MRSYLVKISVGGSSLREAERRKSREGKPGAVAQMEERLICIQQVIGSNPFGSTIRGLIAQLVRAHA